jgi:hypothetical protein
MALSFAWTMQFTRWLGSPPRPSGVLRESIMEDHDPPLKFDTPLSVAIQILRELSRMIALMWLFASFPADFWNTTQTSFVWGGGGVLGVEQPAARKKRESRLAENKRGNNEHNFFGTIICLAGKSGRHSIESSTYIFLANIKNF